MTVEALQKIPGANAEQSEPPLCVLKFGSSVLRTVQDFARIAGELYRQRRSGQRVIAVVSAMAGETDRLFAEAASVTGPASCRGVADVVALGEERSAALLRLACDRIGLPAEICRAEELGILTRGDPLNAEPVELRSSSLADKLASTGLVIVPGFVGIQTDGERALLGRGGSDFSAIFIGGELNADSVRLYKDVDGVFEKDPARFPDARRFHEVSWSDALSIARPLIQPQAVEYAALRRLPIEVEELGSANPTRVCDRTSDLQQRGAGRHVRISLAGYGIVGQAVAERLRQERSFEIVAILVRDVDRERAVQAPCPLTADRKAFLKIPTDVIVDVLSCEETGSVVCNALLHGGVHVVSASKRLISGDHGQLAEAAASGGSSLLYSAAVGGSAAVLETVDAARAAGPIKEVVGILNGTVNYILQRLAQNIAFDDALAEAKLLGFAEENPESDLSGEDAAAKLRLIAHRALGVSPASVEVATERLDQRAALKIAASGERWVQVARVARSGALVCADVSLQPLREVSALPAVVNEWNCAAATLEDGRVFRCLGRGAGGAATAEAIIADLYELLLLRAPDVARRPA